MNSSSGIVLRHYHRADGEWARLEHHHGDFYVVKGSRAPSNYVPCILKSAIAFYEDHLAENFDCYWVPSADGGHHLVEVGNLATLKSQLVMQRSAAEAQGLHPDFGSW